MQSLKSFILAIFQKRLAWPCPVGAALKKVIIAIKKLFLVWIPIYVYNWKTKLESAYIFSYVKIF